MRAANPAAADGDAPVREGAPVLSVRDCSKTFSGVTVLRNASIDIMPGEVHGLVGQNGSGKSTLIKILVGYHDPDPGASISVLGRPVDLPMKAGGAARLGISVLHQDLALIDAASVVENVRLGLYETRFGRRVSWRDERRLVRKSLERLDVHVDPDAQVGTLAPVDRALIAIVRAVEQLPDDGCGLLILDEPTPHLPRNGVERLFATIREVAAGGVGVLFVSHRMDEIRELTDTVTILREGAVVASATTASIDDDRVTELLLGFALDRLYPDEQSSQRSDLALRVRGVRGAMVSDLSLDLHQGEIIGLTGLSHMGWDEVPYLLFGAAQAGAGELEIPAGTRPIALQRFTPTQAVRKGIALLPANRLQDSGVAAASLKENVTLPTLEKEFVGGRLRHGREQRRAQRLLTEHDVRPPDPQRLLATLSGGNQQKALLGKWFEIEPRILLLHEPTQGVDIGARSQIYQRLRAAAIGGMAVVVASVEYEDLANVCDRVLVFRDGQVVSELAGGALTYERVVEQCFMRGGAARAADGA
jgi:ribose transport system ATP-binding protein